MKVLKYKRGQIWWVDLPAGYRGCIQGKTRPILIISNDLQNYSSTCLIGVPLTTKLKAMYLPTHVSFIMDNITNVALCENIMSIDSASIKSYIGTLDNELMTQVEKCIKITLGLTNTTITETIVVATDTNKIDTEFIESADNITDTINTESILADKKSNVSEVKLKRTYRHWNNSQKKEYVDEYDKNGMQYIIKKYDEVSESAVYRKVRLYRQSLKEAKLV